MSLQEDIPAAGLIEQHARIIKEKAVLRELINSAMNIIAKCYTQDDKGIDGVLDHAEKPYSILLMPAQIKVLFNLIFG